MMCFLLVPLVFSAFEVHILVFSPLRFLCGSKVMVRSSVNLQGRNLGSIWRSEDEDRRRALLVGFCYSADLQLRGSWNDVADMQSWSFANKETTFSGGAQ